MEEKTVTTEKQGNGTERTIYELGYHLVPAVGEEGVPKEVSALKEQLEKCGASFISEEFPAHITLAYTMIRARGGKREKFSSAYFGWVKFQMDSAQTEVLKEWLEQNDHVLRYILFKTVREDTRAPKRVLLPQKPSESPRPKATADTSDTEKDTGEAKEKEKSPSVSDSELDRTIDELVVE